MPRRFRAVSSLLCLVFFLPAISSYAQTDAKRKVTNQADLPRFTYPVKGLASELVEAEDATFAPFAAEVRADLESIFRDYEIEDKATLRSLLNAKIDLQQLAGEHQAALGTIDALRAEEEKPSAKLTSRVIGRAISQAVIETKSTSGAAFEAAFKKYAAEAINALPWEVLQDDIKGTYADTRVYSRSMAVAGVKTDLDPSVQKSGALDNQEAWQLISIRNGMRFFIPLETILGEVLKPYIAAHKVEKPDIWAAREVTLTKDQKLTPVLVAIWDSGIDVSLYPDLLFTDPHPTASGTHGLAFNDQGSPSTTWLYPLSAEQQKTYPGFRDEIKGTLDLENGVDSSEADQVQKKFKTLSADKLHQLFELEKWLAFYIHGTHCAGIAVRGNPAARLVVARFNDQLPDLPFPPTRNGRISLAPTSNRWPTISRRGTCAW